MCKNIILDAYKIDVVFICSYNVNDNIIKLLLKKHTKTIKKTF